MNPPIFAVLEAVELMANDGESLFDAFERCLLTEAMFYYGDHQTDIAERLRVPPRVLNYKLGALGLRPKDRRKSCA